VHGEILGESRVGLSIFYMNVSMMSLLQLKTDGIFLVAMDSTTEHYSALIGDLVDAAGTLLQQVDATKSKPPQSWGSVSARALRYKLKTLKID